MELTFANKKRKKNFVKFCTRFYYIMSCLRTWL